MAKDFLEQMQASPGLEVVLIPAPDPRHAEHKVRIVQSQNPAWYSKFCKLYVSCRGIGKKKMQRPRTFINRRVVIHELERIANADKRRPNGITRQRLTDFIRREVMRARPSRAKRGQTLGSMKNGSYVF